MSKTWAKFSLLRCIFFGYNVLFHGASFLKVVVSELIEHDVIDLSDVLRMRLRPGAGQIESAEPLACTCAVGWQDMYSQRTREVQT